MVLLLDQLFISPCLYPVAQAFPPCLKSVAAAYLLVEQSSDLVLQHLFVLAVPHSVAALLLKTTTQHFSQAQLTKYELNLSSANITIQHCSMLNPVSLLPSP